MNFLVPILVVVDNDDIYSSQYSKLNSKYPICFYLKHEMLISELCFVL